MNFHEAERLMMTRRQLLGGASTFTYKKAVTSDSDYLLSNLFEVIVWQAQLACQY